MGHNIYMFYLGKPCSVKIRNTSVLVLFWIKEDFYHKYPLISFMTIGFNTDIIQS